MAVRLLRAAHCTGYRCLGCTIRRGEGCHCHLPPLGNLLPAVDLSMSSLMYQLYAPATGLCRVGDG